MYHKIFEKHIKRTQTGWENGGSKAGKQENRKRKPKDKHTDSVEVMLHRYRTMFDEGKSTSFYGEIRYPLIPINISRHQDC